MPDDEKLVAIRAALPSLAAGIQLNTGSVGPMPAEVAAAMAEIAEYERTVGRSHPDYHREFLERMDEARAAVAAVLGAEYGSVGLTHAATDGMNIASNGLDWRPGDVAVTTTHEHAGGLGPLYALRERLGVIVRFADIGDGSDDDLTVEAFDRAIGPGVRLVSLSHVLWTTGAVLPVARIARLAHERGAIVVVDGAQAVGAIPVTVGETGADAYALPAQKWLLGPEGMGALWISPDVGDRLRPPAAGYHSMASYDLHGGVAWHTDGRRFEAAGFHRPSVTGMARAIGWLSMFVGLDFVYRRGAAMARRAADALAGVAGVSVLTPRDGMAGLVTFRIAGWGAAQALEEIAARTFAVARTIVALDALRISVGFFNSEEELDRFVDGVRLIAAHTPATLPSRRTLTVLGA